MELINWSLSAIDKIFSLRKSSPGEPSCPDGTFSLEALSVEDVEDLFIFGTLIVGFLLLGIGIALTYRKICKTAASKFTLPLSVETKGCLGDVSGRLKELHQRGARTEELHRETSARVVEVLRRMDTIGTQSIDLLRTVSGLSMKLDEMSKSLHDPTP